MTRPESGSGPEAGAEMDSVDVSGLVEGLVIPVQLAPRQTAGVTHFSIRHLEAKSVMIAGDFNNWDPQPLKVGKWGVWEAGISLAPGSYHYKYVIDNHWVNDPNNPDTSPNDYGSQDSVVWVT